MASSNHYYVPNPSPWPIITSLGLFLLALGTVLLINKLSAGPWFMTAGAAIIIYMMVRWFGQVIEESERGAYNAQVDRSFRWGMSWFIFSELMFFAAFFGTLLAGAIPVPIYPPFRLDRLEEYAQRQVGILRNAEASRLLTFPEAERMAGLLRSRVPSLEDVTSVGVVFDNLKSGVGTLIGTPILRTLFLLAVPYMFSVGLWNVLLLPFAFQVLHADEFTFGVQEGLTSVGFVVGSLLIFGAFVPAIINR